jgi:hypothetical protein
VSLVRKKLFIGVIQGLNKDSIDNTFHLFGLKQPEYRLKKASIFRKSSHILFKPTTQNQDEEYSEDDIDTKFDIEILRIGEIFTYGGDNEFCALFLVIILAFLILLFLWVVLVIPLMIIIISLITIGEAWRMLRVYYVIIETQRNVDFRGLIHSIHQNGGTVSTNWLKRADDKVLIDQSHIIRESYIWFMRGVGIIAYSLFTLAFIVLVSYAVDNIFDMTTTTFRFISMIAFGSIAVVGLVITLYYVYQQKVSKSYLHP